MIEAPVTVAAAIGFAVVGSIAIARLPSTRSGRRYAILLGIIFGASAVSYAGIGFGYGQIRLAGTSTMWLHYLEWLVGTPAYVAGLFLLTGSRRLVTLAVGIDLTMVATGFAASILDGAVSAGLFAVSTLSLLGLFVLLVTARGAGGWRQSLFRDLRRLFLVVGPGYPVVWLLGVDGLGRLGFVQTNLAFLALDAVVKVGYAVLVVAALENSVSSATATH